MGNKYDYSLKMHEPELRDVCLNCECEDCEGICDKYKNKYRLHVGGKPLVPIIAKEKQPYVHKEYYAYDGQTHTLSEWAKIKGMSYHMLYMRISRGMAIGDALNVPRRDASMPTRYRIGEDRLSVAQWARKMGVPAKRIYRRLELGYSIDDALRMAIGGHNEF